MNPTTKLPKGIKLIEQDVDGWWAYSKPGYYFPHSDCHTAHEDTRKELNQVIYTKPCNCKECQGELNYLNTCGDIKRSQSISLQGGK